MLLWLSVPALATTRRQMQAVSVNDKSTFSALSVCLG